MPYPCCHCRSRCWCETGLDLVPAWSPGSDHWCGWLSSCCPSLSGWSRRYRGHCCRSPRSSWSPPGPRISELTWVSQSSGASSSSSAPPEVEARQLGRTELRPEQWWCRRHHDRSAASAGPPPCWLPSDCLRWHWRVRLLGGTCRPWKYQLFLTAEYWICPYWEGQMKNWSLYNLCKDKT